MSTLVQLMKHLVINEVRTVSLSAVSVRFKYRHVDLPEIGRGKSFRRIVHYPENYTVKPLEVTNLAGRDPATGRVVVKGIGGGIKHKYHWVQFKREGPKDDQPPKVERVVQIMKDGCRTANIALIADRDQLKYYLASENMKAGDLLKTSCFIPRIPVRAQEGDAYPLGALPLGTRVHNVELIPNEGGFLAHAAGTFVTIVRKVSNRVIILTPSKREFSLLQTCMCTVGRVSNVEHQDIPIGSAQRMRELGGRPRSGWWQRKTGRFGRKIRRPPRVKEIIAKEGKEPEFARLTLVDPFY